MKPRIYKTIWCVVSALPASSPWLLPALTLPILLIYYPQIFRYSNPQILASSNTQILNKYSYTQILAYSNTQILNKYSYTQILAYSNTQPDPDENLAKIWCGGCHLYPEPALLDTASWQRVLPAMGHFLGIYPGGAAQRESLIEGGAARPLLEAADVFPAKPRLSAAELARIRDFYLRHAPPQLRLPAQSIPTGLRHFTVKKTPVRVSPPGLSLVKFGPEGRIYAGDTYSKKLFVFDRQLQLLQGGRVAEGITQAETRPDGLWLTAMGSFSPTEAPVGFLLRLDPLTGQGVVPIDGLQRPVHAAHGDFNGDGRDDVVVCEYGKYTGALNWWANCGADSFARRPLLQRPGAIKSFVRDLNGDGHPDVAALFGQGDEGIFFCYNDGRGNFQPEPVLRFSPANGSSGFDLTDFNGDGHVDILYTCGDNADFRPVPKPWHGIYVYLNDGKNTFRQHLFLPLPGAYSAIARDFDRDGDLDIASVAFFPDFSTSLPAGFVYWEQQAGGRFTPATFAEVGEGRWMVMDVADYDRDGDEDIVLGSMTFEVPGRPDLVQRWSNGGLPFLVLENKSL